jgi:hypothetical protein
MRKRNAELPKLGDEGLGRGDAVDIGPLGSNNHGPFHAQPNSACRETASW